ncbi:amino acid permease [Clostridium niameyense]|uniref:Amino acid permease n=1 Tax=Clostridium niameyense TaxID=1622073 RepID=A0A6M0R8C2_9CLOT|nr:amino acid permease [Clostridium niameyense]NEZ46466.1 amino acid permease [Clostridium niameyense]
MQKSLKFKDMVLMTMTAILGLRWVAVSAKYGASCAVLWGISALLFFIPSALVAAELGGKYPEQGGLSIWVTRAYGEKMGFLVSWLNWVSKLFFYPGFVTYAAVTFAYVIDPNLANNKFYNLFMVLGIFWFITLWSFRGTGNSKQFAVLGGLVGSVIPALLVIILGYVSAFVLKRPLATHYTVSTMIPDFSNISNLALLSSVMFGLTGAEVTAAFAGEVENGKKVIPKAIIFCAIFITILYILCSSAITFVVKPEDIGAANGLIEAFRLITEKFGIGHWFLTLMSLLMTVEALGGTSLYIMSPITMLFETSKKGVLPSSLTKTNKNGVPTNALLVQAVGISIVIAITTLLPTVNAIYSILIIMTAITGLIPYLLMFSAYIKIKKREKTETNSTEDFYEISKSKNFSIVVGIIGFLSVVFGIVTSFFPPSDYTTTRQIIFFELLSIGGPILLSWIGWKMFGNYEKKKSQQKISG